MHNSVANQYDERIIKYKISPSQLRPLEQHAGPELVSLSQRGCRLIRALTEASGNIAPFSEQHVLRDELEHIFNFRQKVIYTDGGNVLKKRSGEEQNTPTATLWFVTETSHAISLVSGLRAALSLSYSIVCGR